MYLDKLTTAEILPYYVYYKIDNLDVLYCTVQRDRSINAVITYTVLAIDKWKEKMFTMNLHCDRSGYGTIS